VRGFRAADGQAERQELHALGQIDLGQPHAPEQLGDG
jgi:hypothetical protein